VLAGSFLNASMVLIAIIGLTLIFVCLLLVNRRPLLLKVLYALLTIVLGAPWGYFF
jgi:hypothetical protein